MLSVTRHNIETTRHDTTSLLATAKGFTWKAIFIHSFICSVFIALSMTPDTQHEGKTNSLETTSDEALFEQQFVFKNIHFNRFQVSSPSIFSKHIWGVTFVSNCLLSRYSTTLLPFSSQFLLSVHSFILQHETQPGNIMFSPSGQSVSTKCIFRSCVFISKLLLTTLLLERPLKIFQNWTNLWTLQIQFHWIWTSIP